MTPAEISEQLRLKREAREAAARTAETPPEPPPSKVIQFGDPQGYRQPPKPEKPLPSSIDAEKGVLCSILLAPSRCMPLAERAVGKSYFHHPAHQAIWQALSEMHQDCTPIDLISLTEHLRDTGALARAGGDTYVTELSIFTPSASNVQHYLEIVREKFALRELALIADRAKEEAINPSGEPHIVVEALQGELDRIARIAAAQDDDLETHTFSSLAKLDTKNDPNSVLGYRWLCRGGSCLIVGQSGLGKSSIAMQAGIMWAQGQTLWGVGPTIKGKRLKSLFIQAENDQGDMAEMMQGVLRSCPIPPGMTRDDFIADLEQYMIFKRDCINTGADFARSAGRIIEKVRPDLVFCDPLLSYVGDDISQQSVASKFLRNTLNPIALNTGIVWMLLHHTGKPSTDPKAKAHWTDHDFSYAAFGSSELVNWARAVNVLRSLGNGVYEFRFAKRGKRAGLIEYQDPLAYDENGEEPTPNFTDVAYLQHAKEGIFWEHIAKPIEVEEQAKKRAGATGQFQPKYSQDTILDAMRENNIGRTTMEVLRLLQTEEGLFKGTTSRSFYSLWKQLKQSGKVRDQKGRWFVV